jgi:hypothetical protein
VALVDVDVELDTVLDDANDGREDVVVDVGDADDNDIDAEGFEPSPNPGSKACEEVGSKAKLALVTVDGVDDSFD